MESPARPVSFAVIYRHDDQYFTPAEYVAHCLAAGHVLPVELGGPVQVDPFHPSPSLELIEARTAADAAARALAADGYVDA